MSSTSSRSTGVIDLHEPQWRVRARKSAFHRAEALSHLLSSFAPMDLHAFTQSRDTAADRSRMRRCQAHPSAADGDLASHLLGWEPLFREIPLFNNSRDHQLDIVGYPLLTRCGAGLCRQQRRQGAATQVRSQPPIQGRTIPPDLRSSPEDFVRPRTAGLQQRFNGLKTLARNLPVALRDVVQVDSRHGLGFGNGCGGLNFREANTSSYIRLDIHRQDRIEIANPVDAVAPPLEGHLRSRHKREKRTHSSTSFLWGGLQSITASCLEEAYSHPLCADAFPSQELCAPVARILQR